MKASELRLGNLVKINGRGGDCIYRVTGISETDIDAQCINRCDPFKEVYNEPIENVSPTPLTEKWLLRFGAKDNDSYFNLLGYPDFKISWSIRIIKNNERKAFFLDDNFPECFQIKLEHVHQLQNLYFALTGEELTLKQ